MITLKELSEETGVKIRTLRSWIYAGLLPKLVLVSDGKGKGMKGLLPASSRDLVDIISSLKGFTLSERCKLLNNQTVEYNTQYHRLVYRLVDGKLNLVVKNKKARS